MTRRRLTPTEHDEQVALFDYAKHAAGQDWHWNMLYAIPNAGGYVGGYDNNVARVQSMKAEGVKKGVPDICLPVPSGPWCGLYIELKRKGGKLTPEQRSWLIALESLRYMACKAEGAEEAIKIIETYLALE